MTINEFNDYYLNLKLGVLGGNHGHFDSVNAGLETLEKSKRYRMGLMVLAVVSLIEANFLNKQDLRTIRNFEISSNVPATVNSTHLACYIYIRDCFAHNPEAMLLPEGKNTNGFLSAVGRGEFPYGSISDNKVIVQNTDQLGSIARRFFEA